MDNSITLLYYTANLPSEFFSKNIRDRLVEASRGKHIISVSQKPMDFGENIVVDLEPSLLSVYKQILIGAKATKTKYIACCEDDTLYVPEHFDHKVNGNFAYNVNHWHLRKDIYYYRGHKIMSMCIAPTELMIEDLEMRFEKYSGNESVKLQRPQMIFRTEIPPITFRHRDSLFGMRRIPEACPKITELPYWGNANELWNKVYG